MKKKTFSIRALYHFLLVVFAAYVLLDTFIIERTYAEVEPAVTDPETVSLISELQTEETQTDTGTVSQNDITITDNAYVSDAMTITLSQYRVYDTDIYVADVVLTSADSLKTALAKNAYGKNITSKTSDIAESVSAVLAINGDYYGAQQTGYVIRNGVLYRDTARKDAEDLVIYADGTFEIIQESEVSAQELLEQGAQQVLCFGPALIENGEIAVTEDDEVGKAKASNPRTAIAMLDELHYLFVVSDGRTNESEGLSLYQLAEFLKQFPVETAYNLDGGGSSTMIFNGTLINNPTTSGRSISERSVSDIVYIG